MTKWLRAQGGRDGVADASITSASNVSLVFNKFGACWEKDGAATPVLDKDKFRGEVERALSLVMLPSGGKVYRCLVRDCDNFKHYTDVLARRAALVTARGGKTLPATSDWRFVTGTGIENPLEVGIELHPVYGVPYWPSPGVKGLTRHFAEHWAEPQIAESVLQRIFGPRLKPGDEGGTAGSVVFFDALPDPDVALEFDVMTPHYGDWYRDAKNAPGDWMSPKVIEFLAVPAGTKFHFAVAPRRPGDAGDLADIDECKKWLVDALSWLGAGAKTKAGYGRFAGPGGQ